jgi:serine/threonine protein kinase
MFSNIGSPSSNEYPSPRDEQARRPTTTATDGSRGFSDDARARDRPLFAAAKQPRLGTTGRSGALGQASRSAGGFHSTTHHSQGPNASNRNPMAGLHTFQNQLGGSSAGDGISADPRTRSNDELLINAEIPWLLQLRRYPILSAAQAEHLLLSCLRDMNKIVSDLFAAEAYAAEDASKELAHAAIRDGLTDLVKILSELPDSSFVDQHGIPDQQFHNVVRGLCHLWGSSDSTQLSTVMRHISLQRPADAVAQAATTCKIVLPPMDRRVRRGLNTADTSRLNIAGYVAVFLNVLAILAGLAGSFGLVPRTVSLIFYLAGGAVSTLLGAFCMLVLSYHRHADDGFRHSLQACLAAGLAKVTTSGVEQATEAVTLGGLGRGGLAGTHGGHASQSGFGGSHGGGLSVANYSAMEMDETGGGGGGGVPSTRVTGFSIPAPLRLRYPQGVLLLPLTQAQPLDRNASQSAAGQSAIASASTQWVCIDARPISKHAMIIGVDRNRVISLWNNGAASVTGNRESDCLGVLCREKFTLPGDNLAKLPRMVGEKTQLQLIGLANGAMHVEATISDIKDANGEAAGHCFIAPASQVQDYYSTKSYVHEFLQLELWDGLENLQKVSNSMYECIRTAVSEANNPLAASPMGFPRHSPMALRPHGSVVQSSKKSGTPDTPLLRKATGPGRGSAASSEMSAPEEDHPADPERASEGDSGPGNATSTAAHDLQLLHTQMVREVQMMKIGVREISWETLNNTVNLIASSGHWEYTNPERLLGPAARYHFDKATVAVGSNVPSSFRLPTSASRIVKTLVSVAPSSCSVTLKHTQRTNRVNRLTVVITLEADRASSDRRGFPANGGNTAFSMENLRQRALFGHRFDFDSLVRSLNKDIFESCATFQMFSSDTAVAVHFPCIRDVGPQESAASAGQQPLLPPVETKCDCTVVVCLQQAVDQHNLGMILLGITGVSLTMCRDTFELQQRLHQADIIIISNLYRDQVDNDCDLDAVVIPVIDEDMPYDSDSSFLRLPFKREEVHQLMVEASEYVAKAKDERKLREEQEIVLRARHDAPWTKGALLGRGTFGVCYVATNEINDAKMAVKQFTVPQRGEQAEKFMRDLVNEIRILKALDHPNIVHYFYCERSDTGVNLFMELCDGSLQDIIKARTSPDPVKRDLYRRGLPTIMQQTLSAVAYLHEMNITHRDLKPQNILVKGDRIKLTDFGTAHQLANKDETLREVQGTLRFMAPEVFKGESYNQSCDTWSIGCLMCVLLEVKVPWMQNKSEHLLVDLQQKDINLDNATHISPEARDLMNLCLQVPKHLRPPVKTLLMHPFVQNLDPTFRISQLTGVKTNVDQSGGVGALRPVGDATEGSQLQSQLPPQQMPVPRQVASPTRDQPLPMPLAFDDPQDGTFSSDLDLKSADDY